MPDPDPHADPLAPGGRVRLVVGGAVLLAVFVVVAGATVLLLGALRADDRGGDDPAAVVRANFEALREGDCPAYLATFSAADRAEMGQAPCRQSALFGAERLGGLTVTATEVEGTGDAAVARVAGTFTDGGAEQSFAFDLVREGGGWVIVQ
ncbi:DUF4878 domain-containing protein [Nocardioides perillae]|uniref:Lumazine-binding protein n=1 Tax=Nocardioides perillae TaxID=1119534 RepID=A0A7Y9UUW1_9ACTN|nr:DUF4878 domain-containing protein [Nocardioides perillae]NYG54015.1 hypothetical protein [Nocardioides perillae]